MTKYSKMLQFYLARLTVSLLAVLCLQVHGQFDFLSATDIAWNEQHGLEGATGGTSLENLNRILDTALSDPTDTSLCYVLSGVPTNALTFNTTAASCSAAGKSGARSASPSWLALKGGTHVDYELGSEQQLTITGYDAAGEEQAVLSVNLVITDYDERPLLTQGSVPTWYWQPGDSDTLLISTLFKDPDGAPVTFDLSSTSTDVWVCDTANAGEFSIDETPSVPDRTLGLGTPVTFTGGDASANCSVSNGAKPSASPPPDPNPGARGSAGNRVVSTTKMGPVLKITADSLVDDTDGTGTVTERGSGTYAAKVFVRVWSGPSVPPLSSTGFASVNIRVKVGANNPPQFAGGAIGFAVTLMEGDDETDPMPSWRAGDLDAGGGTNDALTYSLGSVGSKNVNIAGGSITLKENRGDNPATTGEVETDYLLSLALVSRGLNYESGETQFEINLLVSDDWSPPVEVPIKVTLIDVNEVVVKSPIEDQRLTNGLSRTIDLTQHFEDPEGDVITYVAYSNVYDDIVEVNNETDTLVINGKYATKGNDSTVFVTLVATDSKGTEANLVEFFVTTRYENLSPSIDLLANGSIVMGSGIFEAESAGKVLMPLIAYTDDEPKPTAILTGSQMFRADVDPHLKDGELCAAGSEDCEEQIGKVAIVVGTQNLNHEEASIHKLSLTMQDAWQPELVSDPLEIQVSVFDSNDAPTVVQGMSIPTQSIVVNGSGSYSTGAHFTDEDGDRLLVNATSSQESVATVEVSGLDQLTFKGVAEGESRITLTASDPEGASVSLSFTVRVGPNNRPVADEDAFAERLPADNTINVGGIKELELDGLFTELDGGDMITEVTARSSDHNILLVVSTNNGATSTLIGRRAGTATLIITATDQGANVTSIDTEITINAPPTETMPLDPQILDRVTPHIVDVSGVFVDSDDDDDSTVITAKSIGDGMDRVTVEVEGTNLTINGVMGIEPGDVNIKLTATDPHGAIATSTFVATVVNVDPTVATEIDVQELDRIQPLSVDVTDVFADADGEIVMITPTIGEDSVIEVGEIDLNDGLLKVTGLAVGEATVMLEATDNDGGTVSESFNVTVNNVNPMVANKVEDQTTTRIMDLTLDISETFEDPDTDSALTLDVTVGDDTIANAIVDGNTLTIEGLHVGTTTISVTAMDVDDGTSSTEFTIEVENVKPTVAMSIDDQSFDRRAPLGIDLSATFADADGTVSSITAEVSDGAFVEAQIEGTMLTLNALAVGTETVTLTATDDNGSTITTDVVVTVVNIDPVVANAISNQSTTRVVDLSIDVSSTFHDPDASNDLLEITVTVEDGMLVDASLDGLTLIIGGLQVGTTNITLTASDADGGTVSDTFTTRVENIDPMIETAVPDQEMDRRAPLILDLSDTFSDIDDGAPTISALVRSGHVVSSSPIGDDMILALNALAVGETVVTLTATDVNGASITDEFRITVINIDPTIVNPIPSQITTRLRDVVIDISDVFDDPDADNSMLTFRVVTADSTLVEASLDARMLTIRGLAIGSTMLTLSARDADNGVAEQSFYVTIDNIAPQVAGSISPITLQVGGQPASQAIAGLFRDDGDPLTYTIASTNSRIANVSLSGLTAIVGPVSRGSTTFTIIATDSHGGAALVTGSVTVEDSELKSVAAKSLAAFGRSILASVSSSVGARVATNSRSSDLTLDGWAPIDAHDARSSMTVEGRRQVAWDVVDSVDDVSVQGSTSMSGERMSSGDALRSMIGSEFALNLGSATKPSRWSVWGSLDRQAFEGAGYDGLTTSAYVGADVTIADSWTIGVSISNNSGESDYSWGTASQSLNLDLTTALPYFSFRPSDKTLLWGVAGFGDGELGTTVVGASSDESDLSSSLTMLGGSRVLTRLGRFDLALRADAASLSLESDNGDDPSAGLLADVNRIRVGLEGSLMAETGRSGTLEPFGQVNFRSDGGDGDTGTGIELAGGVRMTSSTFTLEVQGRTLAMHGADDYSESGFSLTASLNPSASATGVSITIAPRWGADTLTNGVLWQDSLNTASANTYGALTGLGNARMSASIDSQIGYGLLVANERYLFTPFVDLRVIDGLRREILLGANLQQLAQADGHLDINLALGRIEEQSGASSGKIGLNAVLRF